jgi:hypothetical protein
MLKAAFLRRTFNVQINPAVFFVALRLRKPYLLLFGKSSRQARARQQKNAERGTKIGRLRLHSFSMTRKICVSRVTKS